MLIIWTHRIINYKKNVFYESVKKKIENEKLKKLFHTNIWNISYNCIGFRIPSVKFSGVGNVSW